MDAPGESPLMFSAIKKLIYSDISILRYHSWNPFLEAFPPVFVTGDHNSPIVMTNKTQKCIITSKPSKRLSHTLNVTICHILKSVIVSKYLVEAKKETKMYSTVSFLS